MNDQRPHPEGYKSKFMQDVRQGRYFNERVVVREDEHTGPVSEACSKQTATNEDTNTILIIPASPSSSTGDENTSTSVEHAGPVGEACSKPQTAKNEDTNTILIIPASPSSSTSDENTSTSVLTTDEVKRCLFAEKPKDEKNESVHRFAKPTENTLQQVRQKNKMPIQMPINNIISVHHYTSFYDNKTNVGEWSAETLRFLIHNTYSYSVRSLLCFVREKGSVSEYHCTAIGKDVFGKVPLSFLEDVYRHRIPIMSFYRRLGCYPYVGEKRVKTCMACDEAGDNCGCPALDTSFYLFCRRPCSKSVFECNKCKNWTVSPHLCFDFFFCEKCDEYYTGSTKRRKGLPTYCV